MRGTAVWSFLFGSVNPHTHIFYLNSSVRVLLGGAVMEGSDTPPLCQQSKSPPYLPPSIPQGYPTFQWLPDPFCLLGEDVQGVYVFSGSTGRGGGHCSCIMALDTKALPLLLPHSSSCGFMAYLLVADFHLAMRGDHWQICLQRFLQGGDLQQGFWVGPDGSLRGSGML